MGAKKVIHVVIDTNVVVSALLFGGTPGKLIPMWRNSIILPYISKEILDEYIRVFSYPRFTLTEDEITYLVYKEILPYFEVVELPANRPLVIVDDPSDDLFLYCAFKAGASFIITGDRHLLSLKRYKNIKITAPTEFVKQYPIFC